MNLPHHFDNFDKIEHTFNLNAIKFILEQKINDYEKLINHDKERLNENKRFVEIISKASIYIYDLYDKAQQTALFSSNMTHSNLLLIVENKELKKEVEKLNKIINEI